VDKDVPGAGTYSPHDFLAIGSKKITGGAPNNFTFLAKKRSRDSFSETVKVEKSPRAILAETSSKIKLNINFIAPAHVGPGSYGSNNQSRFKLLDSSKTPKDSKMFGFS
jgi:hypothetical protein